MNIGDFVQIGGPIIVVCIFAPFLGKYMAAVYEGKIRAFGKIERPLYRILGINTGHSMAGREYAKAALAFTVVSIALLFLILIGQKYLPLNQQGFAGLSWDLALNTAISFVTNTNWQAYSGEASLGYFAQAAGLAVQNFLSAAFGMAVAVALIRGFAAKGKARVGRHQNEIAHDSTDDRQTRAEIAADGSQTPKALGNDGNGSALSIVGIGNFWVDMTRGVLFILLPISIVVAVVLVSQGVIQNLSQYVPFISLGGAKDAVPMGPVASQIAIKNLGTNGGGFFGANAAHPFENPTPFSNFIEVVSMLLIPAGFPFLFGRMIKKPKQGLVIFLVMLTFYVLGSWGALASEYHWGTLEGKELRFGIGASTIWAESTTVTSCGAVNAMHDSLSPLAGLVAMFNIMLGEVIFGGVGSGLYGMLAFVIITVFIAGLMVGRGPEYLGKKIEAQEVKLSMIAMIAPNLAILSLAAIAAATKAGLAGVSNPGPHGLSQILYAFSSAAGNNGSAFAGLGVNNPFYNLMLGLGMLIGRFGVVFPMIGIAQSLSVKAKSPESVATFRTDTMLFGVLLFTIVIIVGGLTHFPALTLGPILEHFLLALGISL